MPILGLISIILVFSMSELAFAEYNAGTAGSPYATSKWQTGSCPRGTHAVGIQVRGGQYVDRLYLMCKGSGSVKNGGGLSGYNPLNYLHYNSSQKTVFCPGNRRLAGINFRSGGYVDKVTSIRCQNRYGRDTEYVGVGVGGNGANNLVTAHCRSGDHITAFRGHAGFWVDHVSVYCD
jgi:hypothetical protein